MGFTTDPTDPRIQRSRGTRQDYEPVPQQEVAVCTKCKAGRPLTEFSFGNSHGKYRRNSWCKWCARENAKARWSTATAEERKAKHDRIEAARRERIGRVYRYLQSHPCVDCGENDPVVLDFDHVRGEKVRSVSQLVCDCRKWSVILDEIAKCEVRCANCHRRKTAVELRWYSYITER